MAFTAPFKCPSCNKTDRCEKVKVDKSRKERFFRWFKVEVLPITSHRQVEGVNRKTFRNSSNKGSRICDDIELGATNTSLLSMSPVARVPNHHSIAVNPAYVSQRLQGRSPPILAAHELELARSHIPVPTYLDTQQCLYKKHCYTGGN